MPLTTQTDGAGNREMVKFIGRIGYVVVVSLALVGLLSVATRFVVTLQYLADPASVDMTAGTPPGAEGFGERYFTRPYLTLVHVVTGALFMVLGPVQFWPAVRNRWIAYHRWAGRVWMLAAAAGVVTALLFVPLLPVYGNLSTRVAVVVAGTLFTICLGMGYVRIRQRRISDHREWMIRTLAIGLGISTFRVLIPLLMMPPISATFPEAWNTVVWLAFAVNLVTAETWINLTRRRPQALPPAAPTRERVRPASQAVGAGGL